MPAPSGATGPSELDLDRLLLETKLEIPAPQAGFVHRTALIAAARASGRSVVAITAPAGYGKSSLLAEWADVEDRPVAWLSLGEYDDDPVTLLTLLARAYAQAIGGHSDLGARMRSQGPSVLGRAAPRLVSVLRASESFVLMIDDLHELRSSTCHDVIAVIAAGVPAGSQLVAASRTEQPHVAWLRASDQVFEMASADLAIDEAGAVQIFAEAHVPLSAEGAVAVTARTEGWPVGLHLAALLVRDSGDPDILLSGEDRYVADYLYREALATLPEEAQLFLRRTAVVERISGELGDALLCGAGSQRRLRELEAGNVFLIPLDRRRLWYRYHPLFREFLLGELRRVEPEEMVGLHTRAADWYESHASPANAVEHLLETGERARCVRLVNQIALRVYESGQAATLRRWFAELGDDEIAGYPPLAVLAGWVAALTGHAREAERWASIVDASAFDEDPIDGTASFASGRAMLRAFMCPAGPEQALRDAEYAVAHEAAWSPWRDLALAVAGEAHLLLGDTDAAEGRFAEASEVAEASGNHEERVLCDAERALLAMDRGAWDRAASLIGGARALIEEHQLHDYAAASLAFPAAARLALHRGQATTAERELAWAMRARPLCTYAVPGLAVRLRLHTARAWWAKGDLGTARHLVHEIEDILLHRPALGALVEEYSALGALLNETVTGVLGGPPLTPAELRLLPYLQTHLTIPEIGARLFVSRNTVSTEVGSIYRKLGVSSRSEAVERATSMGLLGA